MMEADKFLTRVQAAELVELRTGVRIAPRSFEKLPVPYVLILNKARYRRADILTYVDGLLSCASRRVGGRGRREMPAAAAA